jgi:hypothetical protein
MIGVYDSMKKFIKQKKVSRCYATLSKNTYGKFLEVWNLLSRRFHNPTTPNKLTFLRSF